METLTKNNNMDEIGEILANLSNKDDVKTFINELLTECEIEDISQRWNILKLLSANETQRSISSAISVSLCKVTRGAKIIKNEKSLIRKILFDESWRKAHN